MAFFKNNRDEGHLARTRKEQFGYILRNNISTLFFANFLSFIFFTPLIVDITISLIVYKNMVVSNQATNEQLLSTFIICGLTIIPCFIIVGIGLSGLYNIIKCLVFDSTAKMVDFFKGVKSNFKSCFFINLIFGIVVGLLIINIGVYFYFSLNEIVKIIIMIVNVLLLITLLLGKGFSNFEAVVFNNTTYAFLRNGIYLFYKRLPISLLVFLLPVLPAIAILFLPINYVFIPLGFLATFYLSLASLIIFLISIHSYEVLFEKDQIKEIYHRGLENINL